MRCGLDRDDGVGFEPLFGENLGEAGWLVHDYSGGGALEGVLGGAFEFELGEVDLGWVET